MVRKMGKTTNADWLGIKTYRGTEQMVRESDLSEIAIKFNSPEDMDTFIEWMAEPVKDTLRKEVKAFALRMEHKLSMNDGGKGDSWRELSIEHLFGRIMEEIMEYEDGETHKEKAGELVDVANFCMMLNAIHEEMAR